MGRGLDAPLPTQARAAAAAARLSAWAAQCGARAAYLETLQRVHALVGLSLQQGEAAMRPLGGLHGRGAHPTPASGAAPRRRKPSGHLVF